MTRGIRYFPATFSESLRTINSVLQLEVVTTTCCSTAPHKSLLCFPQPRAVSLTDWRDRAAFYWSVIYCPRYIAGITSPDLLKAVRIIVLGRLPSPNTH